MGLSCFFGPFIVTYPHKIMNEPEEDIERGTAVSGNEGICSQRGADGQCQCGNGAEKAPSDQRRARHGQDDAGTGGCKIPGT